MSKVHRAYYRKKNHTHVFAGFIRGDQWTDTLGNSWYDFTTEHGSHFGAVPAEDVTTGEYLSPRELRDMAKTIRTLNGKIKA